MTGFPPGMHRGLPSRHLTFIVSVGPGIDVVAQTDAAQVPASYRCVLSGLAATPAMISHVGHQEGVAIELTPLGCRTLFGMPSRALWNTSLECSDVAGAAGRELWERLQGVSGWPRRFAVCDEVLGRLASTERIVAPELRHAWRWWSPRPARPGSGTWPGRSVGPDSTWPAASGTSSGSVPSWPPGWSASNGPAGC